MPTKTKHILLASSRPAFYFKKDHGLYTVLNLPFIYSVVAFLIFMLAMLVPFIIYLFLIFRKRASKKRGRPIAPVRVIEAPMTSVPKDGMLQEPNDPNT